jgi:hypothetical protein
MSSSRSKSFAAVELPDPDSATSAIVEPLGTWNETLSTAVNGIDRGPPVRILKTFVTSRNSMTGVDASPADSTVRSATETRSTDASAPFVSAASRLVPRETADWMR